MKTEIRLQGAAELIEVLTRKGLLQGYKNAVKKHTADLTKDAKRNAKFIGHYEGKRWVTPTGYTRTKIYTELKDKGLNGRVWVETDYAAYLEFGTRYMDAQPFMFPAYRKTKDLFVQELQRQARAKK